MSNVAIVALPSEDDYVNKISSEKIAHTTILFLGDFNKIQNLSKIIDFTKHATDLTLNRFSLEVDRRGVLGPDLADVLFFKRSRWSGFASLNAFRSSLLQENNIRTAYDSVPNQFTEWNPHITLGYPATPANSDDRDYPGINYIDFDRIAIWFKDYEGIEFILKSYDDDDMMMTQGAHFVKDLLVHELSL